MHEVVLNIPPGPMRARPRLPAWQLAACLLAVTLLVYLPAMRSGYIWDDDSFVTNNHVLTEASGLQKIWFKLGGTEQYYPLTYSTFWLEYRLWGFRSSPSHVINVLLHALNAILLWRVMRLLAVPGAVLAAFFFALHPVEVESVAWITERKNVLSTACYLSAVLAYHQFARLDVSGEPPSRAWRFYLLAVLLYLCALWSKTVTCSLPVALLIVLWWKRDRVKARDVLPLGPLLMIGAVMGWLTSYMEKHYIGASGVDWKLTFAQRLLIAGRVIWFYTAKLIFPWKLTFFYPHWSVNPSAWWQWLFPLCALLVAVPLCLLRARCGKGVLAAVAFFIVTLFPALGFVDIYPFRYSFVADHFQYLASIGPLALAAAGAAVLATRLEFSHLLSFSLCGVLVLLLSVLSWRQCGMYWDVDTLYRATIDRNPSAWIAYDNLSASTLAHGDVDTAIALAKRALALKGDDAEANVNLGNAVFQKGRAEEAEMLYRKAIELKPGFGPAYNDLGNVLLATGRLDAAMESYRSALKIVPGYAEARNNLGFALMQEGRLADAEESFQAALAIRPDYEQAMENLGSVYAVTGRVDDAIAEYKSDQKLNTNNSAIDLALGDLFIRAGRLADASASYRDALQLGPPDAGTWMKLGGVCQKADQLDDARDAFEHAIQLQPDAAEPYHALGQVLELLGDAAGAATEFKQSLMRHPDDVATLNDLAWLLATTLNEQVRNGEAALMLAQRCCNLTPRSDAVYFDTLAAAYAANGNFPEALEWCQVALDHAENNPILRQRIDLHMQSYRTGKPWRASRQPLPEEK